MHKERKGKGIGRREGKGSEIMVVLGVATDKPITYKGERGRGAGGISVNETLSYCDSQFEKDRTAVKKGVLNSVPANSSRKKSHEHGDSFRKSSHVCVFCSLCCFSSAFIAIIHRFRSSPSVVLLLSHFYPSGAEVSNVELQGLLPAFCMTIHMRRTVYISILLCGREMSCLGMVVVF